MKETRVHFAGGELHSPELAGSWLRRLPKVVAAWLAAGAASRPAATRAGTSDRLSRGLGQVICESEENLRHLREARDLSRPRTGYRVGSGEATRTRAPGPRRAGDSARGGASGGPRSERSVRVRERSGL